MIAVLHRCADAELLERFVASVVTAGFDGGEAGALAASARVLGAERCGALFSRLTQGRMCVASCGCVNLLARRNSATSPPHFTCMIAAAIASCLKHTSGAHHACMLAALSCFLREYSRHKMSNPAPTTSGAPIHTDSVGTSPKNAYPRITAKIMPL